MSYGARWRKRRPREGGCAPWGRRIDNRPSDQPLDRTPCRVVSGGLWLLDTLPQQPLARGGRHPGGHSRRPKNFNARLTSAALHN